MSFKFLQTRRNYKPLTIAAFSLLTGMLRGLFESILFDAPKIELSILFSYSAFYFSVYYFMAFGVSAVAGKHTLLTNLPAPALLLGLFPPLLDVIFGNFGDKINYGYYLDLISKPGIPNYGFWFFYMPDNRVPLGESLTVVSLIVLTPIWARVRLRFSILQVIVTFFLAYAIMFFHSYFMPSLLRYFYFGMSHGWNPVSNELKPVYALNMYISLMQIIVCVPVYFYYERSNSAKYYTLRLLHIFPFAALYSVVTSLISVNTFEKYFVLIALFVVFYSLIVQNDYYDEQTDTKQLKKYESMQLFLLISILLAMISVAYKALFSLGIVMALVVGYLYNHTDYKGRSRFYSNLKSESAWALSAILCAWSLDQGSTLLSLSTLVLVLAVVLGWGVVAILKDIKDIEADHMRRNLTLFVHFRRKGKNVSIYIKRVKVVVSALIVSPLLYFLFYATIPLMWLTLTGLTLSIVSIYKMQENDKKYFLFFLAGISVYIFSFSGLVLH